MNEVKLTDIPCMVCDRLCDCENKLERSPKLKEIKEMMLNRTDGRVDKCGIWIALNAPDMIEVDEW